jgi:UDP:flavonoid glycosyltransferase YjiC (YdhE family)
MKPSNAFFADYLPGSECAARSRVVICNGGGMPVQQALAAGVPVIGLVSNIDQLMFSRAVQRTGAGEVIRKRSVTAAEIRRLVWRLIAVDATVNELNG